MPHDKTSTVCIRCGKTSKTVVCMSCFFKYQHSSYEAEKDAMVSFSSRLPKTDLHDDPDMEIIWDDDFLEEVDLSKKNPPQDSDQSTSWFSRLPRF